MRRVSLLLAGPVLAAGLLAGCDLPGGSPQVLGPDQVPNGSAEVAPEVRVPVAIRGTVDDADREDWFRRSPVPEGQNGVEVTCTPNVEVGFDPTGTGSPLLLACDNGTALFPVTPGAQPLVSVGQLGAGLSAYVITARYTHFEL